MEPDNIIRLLILQDSVEQAEHVTSLLRNAGFAVRPERPDDLEALGTALEGGQADLMLVATNWSQGSTGQVSEVLRASGRDVTMLSLDSGGSGRLEAMDDGATDLVDPSNPRLLENVVRREMEHLQIRRRLRRADSQIRELQRRCNALLESSTEAIAYVHEGMYVHVNRAYLDLFNLQSMEEIEGLPILDMVGTDYQGALKTALRGAGRGEDISPMEVRIRPGESGAEPVPAKLFFTMASVEGEPCVQITVQKTDAVDEAQMQAAIRELRNQDFLTGFFNRSHFLEEFDKMAGAAVEADRELPLIYIEMDNFRETLEQLGMGGLDVLLRDAATILRASIDGKGVVARLGDSSFAVLTPGNSLEVAERKAEDIRQAFEGHICEVGRHSVTVTVSIGIARVTETDPDSASVLAGAREAAKRAQASGGNSIDVYSSVAQDDAQELRGWAQRIKQALKQDQFTLAFQPIVGLGSTEQESYEILVRMLDEDGGLIMPGQFFPAAARFGLLPFLDRWVIGAALDKLRDSNEKTRFFIKITPESLVDSDFQGWLLKTINNAQLRPGSVVMEIPESNVVTNLKPSQRFSGLLDKLGIELALEQFGSGLNSFQLLKHVDAKFLKIDRTFMKKLPESKEHQQRVAEITQQAKEMGKVTIAEFVEDAASMSLLWQMGVDFVQGNFLQEPEKILAYDFS